MTRYTFERLRPEYQRLWSQMEVTKISAATMQAKRIIAVAPKERYKAVEARTGVPWFVIGCLHMRESNGDFTTYLGNGQPFNRVTTIVPKGRGPWDSFEDGAEDALLHENLDDIKDWGPEHVAYAAEKFNGFGYRHPNRNIPSPYLWGGTSVQKCGKFIRDGVYDSETMDPQIGAMAVLKQIMAMDPEARFAPVTPVPMPKPKPDDKPNLSPKADDGEAEVKPLGKSKTMWGAVWQWLTASAGAVIAFIQGIPPWLIAMIVVASLVGLYLVIKGRIDVDKIVKHLSNDDTGE